MIALLLISGLGVMAQSEALTEYTNVGQTLKYQGDVLGKITAVTWNIKPKWTEVIINFDPVTRLTVKEIKDAQHYYTKISQIKSVKLYQNWGKSIVMIQDFQTTTNLHLIKIERRRRTGNTFILVGIGTSIVGAIIQAKASNNPKSTVTVTADPWGRETVSITQQKIPKTGLVIALLGSVSFTVGILIK
jgi:hypothetical protein